MRAKSQELLKRLTARRTDITASDLKAFAKDIQALSSDDLSAMIAPKAKAASKQVNGASCLSRVQAEQKKTSLRAGEFAELLVEALTPQAGCRLMLTRATLKSLPKTVAALEKAVQPEKIIHAAIDVARARSFSYDAS